MTLDPLNQRLYLYRFAYVALDPLIALDPNRWALPHLQVIPGTVERQGWHRLLGRCRPFNNLANAAVINPTWAPDGAWFDLQDLWW